VRSIPAALIEGAWATCASFTDRIQRPVPSVLFFKTHSVDFEKAEKDSWTPYTKTMLCSILYIYIYVKIRGDLPCSNMYLNAMISIFVLRLRLLCRQSRTRRWRARPGGSELGRRVWTLFPCNTTLSLIADILFPMMVKIVQNANGFPILPSEPEKVGGCDIAMCNTAQAVQRVRAMYQVNDGNHVTTIHVKTFSGSHARRELRFDLPLIFGFCFSD